MAESPEKRVVDSEHPWLGLDRFTPETANFFFGRDQEIRDIFLRVREFPLTVLYGQSGLGKSSLLGAGLIPKLEVEGYRPRWIRLRFGDVDPPVIEQVVAQLEPSAGPAPSIPGAGPPPPSTLWEIFHHLPTRRARSGAGMPVLIFDQFEEVFTLPDAKQRDAEQLEGRQASRARAPKPADQSNEPTPASSPEDARTRATRARREVEDLFGQLADLIENRPPLGVQERMRTNREAALDYDFGPSPVRVVFTLREDYLSRLETWKTTLPSLMRNRMELLLLNGENALQAVVRPGRIGGGELVSEDVGKRIVWFVAKRPPGTPLEEIGAVPPLLSLLCDELNEIRLKDRASAITAEQVDNQSANILQNFCDRNFKGLHPAVRRFVEDRLITRNGHRNAVDRAEAIEELKGFNVPDPAAALNQLVEQRLLTGEERGQSWRLEITHDVLTPLLIRSRDERRTREAAERAKAAAVAAAREAQARIRESQVKARREAEETAEKIRIEKEAAARERRLARQLGAVTLLVMFVGAYAAWQAKENSRNYKDAEGQRVRAVLAETDAVLEKVNALLAKKEAEDAQKRAEDAAGKAEEAQKQAEATSRQLQDANNVIDEKSKTLEHEVRAKTDTVVKLQEAQKARAIEQERAERLLREITQSALSSARTLYAAEKWDDAVTQLNRAVQNDPEDPSSRIALWTTVLYGKRNHSGLPLRSFRHPGPVRLAALSHNGTRLATASVGSAQVWDVRTASPVGPPLLLAADPLKIEFTPDDTKVMVADKSAVQLVDAATGALLQESLRSSRDIAAASLSPDGSAVAFGYGNTAAIWTPAATKLINVKRGSFFSLFHRNKSDQITSVTFSPDGRTILTTAANSIAQLWNASTGRQETKPLRGNATAAFSPDGTRIATADNDVARIWRAQEGNRKEISTALPHKGRVTFVRYSPDGTQIVTASEIRQPPERDTKPVTVGEEKAALLWNAEGTPSVRLISTNARVTDASFSSDGRRLVITSEDNQVLIADALAADVPVPVAEDSANSAPTLNFELLEIEPPSSDAQFSANAAQIVTIARSTPDALLWNAATGRPAGLPLVHSSPLGDAAFCADGSRVITLSAGGAQVWNSRTGERVGIPLELPNEISQAALSPDGKWAATISGKDAVLWDVASGRPMRGLDRSPTPLAEAIFSPDGSTVSIRGEANLKIFGTAQDQLAASVSLAVQARSSCYSPDGKQIALLTADDSAVQLLDAATGQLIATFSSPPKEAGSGFRKLSFAGTQVLLTVTSTTMQTVSVWDPAGQKWISKIKGLPEDMFFDASLSPDGRNLVTAHESGAVRIWDCGTGQPIGVPLSHASVVWRATFSADGTQIVTASSDKTARIWTISGGPLAADLVDAIARLCSGKEFDSKQLTTTNLDLNSRMAIWDELQKGGALAGSPAWFALAGTVRGPQPDAPVSPISTMTVRQASTALLSTGVEGSIREAAAFDPGNPLVQIALAGLAANSSRAGFLRDFGIAHLPDDAAMYRAAAQILLGQDDKARAGRALEKATRLEPGHPDLPDIQSQLR